MKNTGEQMSQGEEGGEGSHPVDLEGGVGKEQQSVVETGEPSAMDTDTASGDTSLRRFMPKFDLTVSWLPISHLTTDATTEGLP